MSPAPDPGLLQMLAQLQGGGGMPSQMAGPPPMGGPPEAAEPGEGGSNPLMMALMQLLAGSGQGGQPMAPSMPMGGNC
jgi:hypothetical protein